MPAKTELQPVVDIAPSLHFPQAEVITTACGHQHLRPLGYVKLGHWMPCAFCEDAQEAR